MLFEGDVERKPLRGVVSYSSLSFLTKDTLFEGLKLAIQLLVQHTAGKLDHGALVLLLVVAVFRHVLDSVSVTLVMVTLLRHYVIVDRMIALEDTSKDSLVEQKHTGLATLELKVGLDSLCLFPKILCT